GTLGASMIEGRISQGVVVGDGSDVGGGASTMGTLSGGGTERVSIGRRSLVGAEAGVGIALGDDGVVAAGRYVTAGTTGELGGEPAVPPPVADRGGAGGGPRGADRRARSHAARELRPGTRWQRVRGDVPGGGDAPPLGTSRCRW